MKKSFCTQEQEEQEGITCKVFANAVSHDDV